MMFYGLKSVYTFNQHWGLLKTPDEKYQLAEEFQTASSEWITIPFGDFPAITTAMEKGVKILMPDMLRTWYWEGQRVPSPYREFTTDTPLEGSGELIKNLGGINIIEHSQNRYATIVTNEGSFPCQANARGGRIDVYCNTPVDGTLIVQENMYSGWKARLDGKSIELLDYDWLKVEAPQGKHFYRFSYLPFDVFLGLGLTLFGIVLSLWLYLGKPVAEFVKVKPVEEAIGLA
jgi:hypothetical protein